jgi:hypothetical protein
MTGPKRLKFALLMTACGLAIELIGMTKPKRVV